eukprot:2628561-Amphidinium_carterae.2
MLPLDVGREIQAIRVQWQRPAEYVVVQIVHEYLAESNVCQTCSRRRESGLTTLPLVAIVPAKATGPAKAYLMVGTSEYASHDCWVGSKPDIVTTYRVGHQVCDHVKVVRAGIVDWGVPHTLDALIQEYPLLVGKVGYGSWSTSHGDLCN